LSIRVARSELNGQPAQLFSPWPAQIPEGQIPDVGSRLNATRSAVVQTPNGHVMPKRRT
jgi:hypothetical protein